MLDRVNNNANLGIGEIFGSVTGQLLFIGVRNKYCSVYFVAKRKEQSAKQIVVTKTGLDHQPQ